MKIGLVGLEGAGKSTVFGALTGVDVSASHKTNISVVKVPDPRIDALARLYEPKKITYAEIAFTDIGGGRGGLDRAALNAMRDVDALCQVVRGFPDLAGEPPDPIAEIDDVKAALSGMSLRSSAVSSKGDSFRFMMPTCHRAPPWVSALKRPMFW